MDLDQPRRLHAFRQWRQAVITAHRERVPLHLAWRDAFENLLTDLGLPPESTSKLKRRDKAAGYTPENVYWDG